MTRELSTSDRGRALCVLSAEHEALQQQAKNVTAELMHHMHRLSQEHEALIKKMIALDDLRAKL